MIDPEFPLLPFCRFSGGFGLRISLTTPTGCFVCSLDGATQVRLPIRLRAPFPLLTSAVSATTPTQPYHPRSPGQLSGYGSNFVSPHYSRQTHAILFAKSGCDWFIGFGNSEQKSLLSAFLVSIGIINPAGIPPITDKNRHPYTDSVCADRF